MAAQGPDISPSLTTFAGFTSIYKRKYAIKIDGKHRTVRAMNLKALTWQYYIRILLYQRALARLTSKKVWGIISKV